jgi:ubiquinone/menaquinone biosynthesis C-methylase UbiE
LTGIGRDPQDNAIVTQGNREIESELLMKLSQATQIGREKIYVEHYEGQYQRRRLQNAPAPRRQRRIENYCAAIGKGKQNVLELGCGVGDLTFALGSLSKTVVGADVSFSAVKTANLRRPKGSDHKIANGPIAFVQMNATNVAFPDDTFDAVLSTSMIEHLYSDDVALHLREVCRVLKPGGKYLVWCPNALGRHSDRDVHLSMFSYRALIAEMGQAGFADFRSGLFNRFGAGVNARWKVFLEDALTCLRMKILWSHLGVRNILLVAAKVSRP